MPRLNHNDYTKRHHFLMKAWLEFPRIYSALSPRQQWDIHAYFQPSKELTDAQLREHRRSISASQPSLPHRAGRAFVVIDDTYQRAAALPDRKRSPLSDHPVKDVVRTYPIMKPEPDSKRLAKAFIRLAQAMYDEHPTQDMEAA
jgi:hypothetical protein